jgi:hypothetical protein
MVSVRLSHHARRTGTVAATAAFLVAGLAAAPAFAADPAGNNGTIKIDSKPFDDAPNNEPHVGCRFQVDFYGYDLGDYNADVTFSVQPPSGKFDVVETDSVFVGEDAAGGGTDLDASRTYSLSPVLGGYAVNPQQGFHIKVEVNAPGSIGADKKSKVFWVQSCVSSGGGDS